MTSFFAGIEQTPVTVGDQQLDTPAFYEDAGAVMGLFPARMGAVGRLLPDPELRPARLAPGVTLVAVVGYRYRETPVGPYDEVGIMVPLADRGNLPLQALVAAQRGGRSHWYVHWLPVNRDYASHGSDIWGFETGVCEIEFSDDDRSFSLADDDGPILEMHCGPVKTRPAEKVLNSVMHTWLDGQAQSCEVRVNVIEDGTSSAFGRSRLTLDPSHPRARELGGLLLSRRAVATSLMPRSQSILFAPDRLTPAVLRRLGLVEGAMAEARA